MPAVEVDSLVVRYGDITAVRGISLAAEAGDVTVVLGPNGAGKTSTIEVLEGYRRADAGSARVLGLDPNRDRPALVRRMGVMLQGGGIYPGIRVGEAVELFCAYHGRRRGPAELLSLVGLADRRTATYRRLSGGEQQRLSLALALAGEPEVLFLDEPTSGVDVGGRQILRDLVRDLAARGACVLLTTHELDEAERLADRVLILARGEVVAEGSLDELRGDAGELTFTGPPGLPAADLAARLGVQVGEHEPGSYTVHAPADPSVVAAVTAWLAEQGATLGELRTTRKLEQVFLRAVEGRG